jgi:predicted enzyme related to lactoylglutathione lyase
MGERTGYTPGTFCWADLATTDADAARDFYEALFGWEHEDVPVGEGSTYTILRVDGRSVCALYRQQAEGPPAWLSYVSVEDVDASTARAAELGGSKITGPMDVFEAGRMAVLSDPQGAVFGLWQPRETFGAELVNDPGAMCTNQLNTPEPEGAQAFYGELFGWRFEAVEGGGQPFWGVYNGEGLNGGMMPVPVEAGPPQWLVYFTSADLDGSVANVEELGGRVVVAPMPIPAGRIAVARDPQGAVFALFEGPVDP